MSHDPSLSLIMDRLRRWSFLSLLALALYSRCTFADVVGGAVMHHGALTLDPRNFNGSSDNATDAALALHYAALNAGRFIQSLEPDVIVLVTPHGLTLPQPFLLYDNLKAEGSVTVDDWLPCSFGPCVYNASAKLDLHLTHQLASHLSHGTSLTTISGFGPPGQSKLPLPLAWAEVIPLHFISQAYIAPPEEYSLSARPFAGQGPGDQRQSDLLPHQQQRRQMAMEQLDNPGHIRHEGRTGHTATPATPAPNQHAQPGNTASSLNTAAAGDNEAASASMRRPPAGHTVLPRLVILSLPSRRYEHSVSMIPELLSLGKGLFTLLDALDDRVVIVVSGDLAHTWDPAGPYGFNDHAARFDAAATQWARDLDRDALLHAAAKSVGDAKSCGFPGLVLLQGLMDQVNPDNMHSVLLDYGHPSYYGMMCAVFDFQGDA